jgi:NifU-like protein involved in Fe-S cluster formation
MMTEQDLISLYSARILELTTQIPHLGRLEGPCFSATARAPQCGSTVTVDVMLHDGRIVQFAQSVKACALGQASAAVFGAGVLGQSAQDIAALRATVAQMLREKTPPPAAPFTDYAALQAAQAYKNRHASILLCMDATLAAIAKG